LKGQKGVTLVEALIAVAILGVIAVGIFLALNVSLKTTALVDQSTTAESLTRTALEIIKQSDYETDAADYQDEVDANMAWGDRYDVQVAAPLPLADDVQQVTVDVYYDGVLVTTTDAYKANL
jgi:prepilin-type N-terminal cleavage/methylation domain-containing protein